MLIDVWDLQAIGGLEGGMAFRLRAANVGETRLCAVANLEIGGSGRIIRHYVRWAFALF
jgi:hypothetical protein